MDFNENELYVIRDTLWSRLKFLSQKYPENTDIAVLKSSINKIDNLILTGGKDA